RGRAPRRVLRAGRSPAPEPGIPRSARPAGGLVRRRGADRDRAPWPAGLAGQGNDGRAHGAAPADRRPGSPVPPRRDALAGARVPPAAATARVARASTPAPRRLPIPPPSARGPLDLRRGLLHVALRVRVPGGASPRLGPRPAARVVPAYRAARLVAADRAVATQDAGRALEDRLRPGNARPDDVRRCRLRGVPPPGLLVVRGAGHHHS